MTISRVLLGTLVFFVTASAFAPRGARADSSACPVVTPTGPNSYRVTDVCSCTTLDCIIGVGCATSQPIPDCTAGSGGGGGGGGGGGTPNPDFDSSTASPDLTPITGPNPGVCAGGAPVNYISGAMWHKLVDFEMAGRTAATSIRFERTYLAMPALKVAGDFGPHWFHNWETKLLISSSSGGGGGGGTGGGGGGSELPPSICQQPGVNCLPVGVTPPPGLICQTQGSWQICMAGPPASGGGGGGGAPLLASTPVSGGGSSGGGGSGGGGGGGVGGSTSSSDIVWIDQNGGGWVFKRQSDNSLKAPAGLFATLSELSDRYELRQKTGVKLIFARATSPSSGTPAGALLSIVEPHGEAVTLSYTGSGKLASISTGLAGTVSLARDSAGHVTRVTRERDGLSYAYTFDTNGNLSSSADFDSNTTRYTYLTQNAGASSERTLLSSIEDPLHRKIEFTYYPDGRAFTQTEPGGGHRKFTYLSQATSLNAQTQVDEIDGTTSHFSFDSRGRLTRTALPSGAETSQTWTDQNEVATYSDELGFVTAMGYDPAGNLSSYKRPEDPAATLVGYDPNFSKPTLVVPLTGAPMSFSVNPANGDTTAMARSDESGALSLVIGFDSLGHPLQVSNGLASYANQRDANGLLTTVFDTHNPETLAHDARGRVVRRSFAGTGRVLTYTWDNFDRLIHISDSHGPSESRVYDVIGRLLSRTVSDGHTNQTTSFQYDDRDRLISTVDAAGRTVQYFYDRIADHCKVIDQPSKIVDPAGRVTLFERDVMQRLVKKIAPDAGATLYDYNLRGDLTGLTDPGGVHTTFKFDGNRRVVERDRPSVAGTTAALEKTFYRYDAGGRLLREETVSASGDGSMIVTEYGYNALDRVVRKTQKRESSVGALLDVQDDSSFSYSRELDVTRLVTANNGVENLAFTYEAQPPFALSSFRT
ncbi:MAG: RHS repeat protein, partial [Deltaproteobacteria bacterium]|nr:RHS repeat protein [Deltaproteobacteria bacterium]